ncbi:MAG: DUF29 domain-containing protein [Pseudomonadota bacterium]|nr:DUF29 domain-containing protein [Pseudomonadota bacterium]
MSNSYQSDFYGWAVEQARLLRAGRLGEADIANIAEEIDSMGRSERRELVSRLAVLLTHLLKWQVQPGLRGNSWRLTIVEQRIRLAAHLADNPSLRPDLPKAFADAWRVAIVMAERETGLPNLPQTPPCSYEQAMDEGFWPV